MRHSIPLAAVACTLALACGEPATAPQAIDIPVMMDRGESHHFNASQSGRDEVPANTTKSRGHATFWLSDDGTELRYRLTVANIENVTQAHIHLAAEGVNGPVVVFLYGFNPAGITTNGILAEGTITQANLIPRPAIAFGGTMAELVARMRTGGAYVNTHTIAIPGGQVRGQVKENGPSDLLAPSANPPPHRLAVRGRSASGREISGRPGASDRPEKTPSARPGSHPETAGGRWVAAGIRPRIRRSAIEFSPLREERAGRGRGRGPLVGRQFDVVRRAPHPLLHRP